MKSLLKTGRENKQLTTREVSERLKIDQALISKFESGKRNPTHEQLLQLCKLFEIDSKQLEILWLKNKILEIISEYDFGPEALQAASLSLQSEPEIITPEINAASIQKLMTDMESLKAMLAQKK